MRYPTAARTPSLGTLTFGDTLHIVQRWSRPTVPFTRYSCMQALFMLFRFWAALRATLMHLYQWKHQAHALQHLPQTSKQRLSAPKQQGVCCAAIKFDASRSRSADYSEACLPAKMRRHAAMSGGVRRQWAGGVGTKAVFSECCHDFGQF